jgi:membrane-associated phospholipid phosphatase
LVLFLQSLESDVLNSFFLFWTAIGYSRWTTPLMLVILFGVSFRAGFVMMQAMIWNGMTTLFLKDIFAIPRPSDVDAGVKLIGQDTPNTTPFSSMGAKTFFGGLPQDVVSALRENPISTWGFPSGHTSNAMTMGGLLFFIFRKWWVRVLAVAMIVFIPLSRMYLGRHFLADVLGGYVLGFIFVLIFYFCVFRSEWIERNLFKKPIRLGRNWKYFLCMFYFIVLPFLLLLVPHIYLVIVAMFLGLNVGFLLVWIRGIPEDSGTIFQRLARILVVFVVFFVSDFLLKKVIEVLFTSETELLTFIRIALTAILFLWGSTELCVKLHLYKREGSRLNI